MKRRKRRLAECEVSNEYFVGADLTVNGAKTWCLNEMLKLE